MKNTWRTSKRNTISLDIENESGELENDISDENKNNPLEILLTKETKRESIKLLTAILESLEPEEKAIISRIYFDGIPKNQVAKEIGMAKSNLSRKIKTIFKKIRKGFLPLG